MPHSGARLAVPLTPSVRACNSDGSTSLLSSDQLWQYNPPCRHSHSWVDTHPRV
jgi:hypothetical protein